MFCFRLLVNCYVICSYPDHIQIKAPGVLVTVSWWRVMIVCVCVRSVTRPRLTVNRLFGCSQRFQRITGQVISFLLYEAVLDAYFLFYWNSIAFVKLLLIPMEVWSKVIKWIWWENVAACCFYSASPRARQSFWAVSYTLKNENVAYF